MRRWLVVVAALALLVAACGGGDDAASGGDEVTTTTTSTSAGNDDSSVDDSSSDEDMGSGDEDTGSDGDDHANGGSSGAVDGIGAGSATINGQTYLFGDSGFPALQCKPDLFGVFFAVLQRVDEQGNAIPGGGLELILLQPGSDPEELDQRNEAKIRVGEPDEEWIADEEDVVERELETGTSQVDSYTIDGNRVTGTATFYEEDSYWASVGDASNEVSVAQGTFEVTCAG